VEYSLRAMGQTNVLPLTERQFNDLKNAKQAIMHTLSAEQNFEIMMDNYVELEETLFSVGMDYLAFGNSSHTEFRLKRDLISRRLINLFASVRLYRNTIKRRASSILGRSENVEKLRSAMEDSAAQPMAYRLMEAVRNYSQHDDLPLSGLSLNSRWDKNVESGELHRLAYSVTPKMDGSAIAQRRRGLPEDVRSALSALGSQAEIMPLVRKALERWGEIHKVFRDGIENLTATAEALIREALTMVQASQEEKVFLVFLRSENPVDNFVENIQLFEEFITQLHELRNKNRSQINLANRYVEWSDNS
jgi:hypothetical protein